MKKTIKGIVYDTTTSTPKCTFKHGKPIGSIVETAYLTSTGHYFLVQAGDVIPQQIIAMDLEDMARWSAGETVGLYQKK